MINSSYVATVLISVGIGGFVNGICIFCFQKNVNKILEKKKLKKKEEKI